MIEDEKKIRENGNQGRQTSALRIVWKIVSVLAIVTTVVLYYFNYTAQYAENEIQETQEVDRIVSVSQLDINEQEYVALGLNPSQKPVKLVSESGATKTYYGRFLHITDIHPDEEYVEGSSIKQSCHRGDPNKKNDKASKFGDALKGCDAPMALVDETFAWIDKNLKDKVDFVIWTGDNARHDQDRKIPRTEDHIIQTNHYIANHFHNLFHNKDSPDPRDFHVKVVPSLGNNDVYPHNLFAPGPTLQTREIWNIWQNFIPQEQLHVFERGAYFFQEVIPNQLAVLSINTLYWFKANPLVDNCDEKQDPGHKLFNWLGITLQELRDRKMKVWLSGHVPPIPKNYDISCYRKFAMWVHEYRDIIIGGVYGHMNLDHFVPMDSKQAYDSYLKSLGKVNQKAYTDGDENDFIDLEEIYDLFDYNLDDLEIHGAKASNEARLLAGAPGNKEAYMEKVRKAFYSNVVSSGRSGENSDRYSISIIAASVIPTFNPGMRIWEYNITGIEDAFNRNVKPWDEFFKELNEKVLNDDEEVCEKDDLFDIRGKNKKNKKNKKKKKKKAPDTTVPPKMPQDAELGPAYTPQTFSPTRFVQYYMNLTAVNLKDKEFGYEVEYTSDSEPYNMTSLLVDDWLKLSRNLAKPIKNKKLSKKKLEKLQKLWEAFKFRTFASTGYHD